MFHPRYTHLLFGLILSGLMSAIVSFIATARSVGLVPELPGTWFPSWLISWAVAFPTVLVVAPVTRRIVSGLVRAG